MGTIRPCLINGEMHRGERFFRQSRRFDAGGLSPGKENQRGVAEKDPLFVRFDIFQTRPKKKRLIVFLSLLLIGAAALFFHMYTSSQDSSSRTMYGSSQNAVSGADALSEEEAWKNTMAERLASSIKCLENVEDVSVNTEAEPVEVDITMSDTTPLSSDAREGIGRLADAMLPDAAVDFMEPDSKK